MCPPSAATTASVRLCIEEMQRRIVCNGILSHSSRTLARRSRRVWSGVRRRLIWRFIRPLTFSIGFKSWDLTGHSIRLKDLPQQTAPRIPLKYMGPPAVADRLAVAEQIWPPHNNLDKTPALLCGLSSTGYCCINITFVLWIKTKFNEWQLSNNFQQMSDRELKQ